MVHFTKLLVVSLHFVFADVTTADDWSSLHTAPSPWAELELTTNDGTVMSSQYHLVLFRTWATLMKWLCSEITLLDIAALPLSCSLLSILFLFL